MTLRKVLLVASMGALVGSVHPAFGDLISVRAVPSTPAVQVGDVFTVKIFADIPVGIIGWGLDLGFDGALLSHDATTEVAIGPSFLPFSGPDLDALGGLVPFPGSLTGLTGVDVLLATMTFTALDVGTSVLGLGYTIGDPTEGFAAAPVFPPVSIELEFTDGIVTVTPVPAPGAALLGLVGFGFIGKMRRRLAA
ncbi:MAG: hypothetical protein ACE5E6_01510 [Phycisphaerae bacterium]